MYKNGNVPNAIPTSILVDTIRVNYKGRESKMVFRRTLMPSLTVYRPIKDKANNIGLIIFSGGGYAIVADAVEGKPAARYFAEVGYTVFVCHYRVPRNDLMTNKEIVPVQDAQRAIQYVRSNCKMYDIDSNKIGIMGFSAGGHLASTAGTHYLENLLKIRII